MNLSVVERLLLNKLAGPDPEGVLLAEAEEAERAAHAAAEAKAAELARVRAACAAEAEKHRAERDDLREQVIALKARELEANRRFLAATDPFVKASGELERLQGKARQASAALARLRGEVEKGAGGQAAAQ